MLASIVRQLRTRNLVLKLHTLKKHGLHNSAGCGTLPRVSIMLTDLRPPRLHDLEPLDGMTNTTSPPLRSELAAYAFDARDDQRPLSHSDQAQPPLGGYPKSLKNIRGGGISQEPMKTSNSPLLIGPFVGQSCI